MSESRRAKREKEEEEEVVDVEYEYEMVVPTHLFLALVLTVMALPRRDGPRKSEELELELGPLIVSVDFQLSVLELVAELLRASFSFLVMVDQQSQLGDGHGRV